MRIVKSVIAEMHSGNNFQWEGQYPQAEDFAADIANGNLFVFTGQEPNEYHDLVIKQVVWHYKPGQ